MMEIEYAEPLEFAGTPFALSLRRRRRRHRLPAFGRRWVLAPRGPALSNVGLE